MSSTFIGCKVAKFPSNNSKVIHKKVHSDNLFSIIRYSCSILFGIFVVICFCDAMYRACAYILKWGINSRIHCHFHYGSPKLLIYSSKNQGYLNTYIPTFVITISIVVILRLIRRTYYDSRMRYFQKSTNWNKTFSQINWICAFLWILATIIRIFEDLLLTFPVKLCVSNHIYD